jgi:hypothetical protein
MKCFVRIAGVFGLLAAGCSSAESAPPAQAGPVDAGVGPSTTNEPAPAEDAGSLAPTPACAAPPAASKCGIEGSWVRGTAHFDPAHFGAGAKPVLRVSLRHSFTLFAGEEKIGGRLHAYKSIPIKNLASGSISFAIDMCMFGKMWSEENGSFNVVLHIDENGNNDIATAQTNEDAVTVATPDDGELAKIVKVDISCNAPSPCVEATLDCHGSACTTIEPIGSCKKKSPGCKSDDAYCD